MAAYFKQEFKIAHRHFQKVNFLFQQSSNDHETQGRAKRRPDPASTILAARCEHFLRNPPPPDWDGCDVLKSKEY